ncbi:hypothetical protein F4604DRAFT_1930462 [Suillus subluteus]|nr:hypothetical protein F4604DRAFT_1930462 [Suillus subluteus]
MTHTFSEYPYPLEPGAPPPQSMHLPPGRDYIQEQYGGGRHPKTPLVELTPTRLRSRIKVTQRDVGIVKEAAIRRQENLFPPDALTVTSAPGNGIMGGDVSSAQACHPSPRLHDPDRPHPAALQDMFYNTMEAQPSGWLPQHLNFEQMDDASFTELLMETQGQFMSSDAGPSFTSQASSSHAPSHEPPAPPEPPVPPVTQGAEGCSHQIEPMTTNVIPPTPLKDVGSSYSLSDPPRYPSPHEHGASVDAGNINDLFSDPQDSKDAPSSTSDQPFVPGWKSANNNAILEAAFIEIEQSFLELSRSTSIPVQQVINCYFKDHTEQELARVGYKVPADGGSPGMSIQTKCHDLFKEAFPDTYKDILSVHDEADTTAAKFGFETTMVICGKIVNQDASLGQVHTTPGATEFWITSKLMSIVDDAFNDLPEDDEEAASRDADSIPSTEVEGHNESLRWLKKAIATQVTKLGGKFASDKNFPWKTMPSALAPQATLFRPYKGSYRPGYYVVGNVSARPFIPPSNNSLHIILAPAPPTHLQRLPHFILFWIHGMLCLCAQLVSSGLGQHFFPGAELRRRRLLNQMQQLMNPTSSPIEQPPAVLGSSSGEAEVVNLPDDLDFMDVAGDDAEVPKEISSDMRTNSQKRRILPDKSADSLYGNWRKLIPTLVDPQLKYYTRTLGQALEKTHDVISACGTHSCVRKTTNMLCLFFDRFVSINVLSCECSSLPQVLLHHGLFPTAPSQPRMAVSVELLSFYRALFECSCDAINALASTLRTHYSRRGFQVTDSRGGIIHEPFRRGLGHAVQWYDVLQVKIEQQADVALQQSRDRVASSLQRPLPGLDGSTSTLGLQYGRCAPLLVQRWPACFGGALFGRPVHQGGDIHVATDGNFHHRHRRSAGDCPRFYEPTYFIPKQFVDAIGLRIDVQRKRPVKAHAPLVPDEAIDLCENAYEAADGKKQKAAMDSFDDTGLMALICRHDIPLFFANIDSPGEQQKYSVALIEHLFTLLPPQATVVTLYDVGCVLAHSIAKFDILPEDVTSRLRFATTAMHAYGHEWACQLVHNPRMCIGLGLSDGEGTERLWSRFVRLIGVERSSSRCLWLIDRQASAIGTEMKADLGDWIKRRHKQGVKDQGSMALDVINRCETSVEDLQAQWADQ